MAAGVRVYGIPVRCTEKEVKIHFAKSENGGGPIEAVYYPLLEDDAVIIYTNPKTTDEVLQQSHTIKGVTLDVEPLPIPQVFTTMEAKFDASVLALIQTTDEVRDELQYNKNVEFCTDNAGNIIGMRGNWYLLEWVWSYFRRIASRQSDKIRYPHPTSSREHEPRSSSPMQVDDSIKSMPSATNTKAEVKDKSTVVKEKIEKSATAQTKLSTQKKTTQTENGNIVTGMLDKKDVDKNIEMLEALAISEPDKDTDKDTDITIISGSADDFRTLDFRYGPLTVSVYTGLITMAETDAIVNAANGSLAHYGGVASAIASAAGPEMQRQCDDYYSKSGYVPTTQVMHTCAGGEISLKVKYIMHAVGPIYSSTRPRESALQLTQTFLNCLKYGNDVLKIETVAMPVISSGIFGCPLEECVRSFFNAVLLFVHEYMSDIVHLKEVHLVNNNSDQTALTVMQLREIIALGTQTLVLEAQQQMQQETFEDVGYKLSRESGQRLKLDREPLTSKSKYDFTSVAERDYDFDLTTRSPLGTVDYSLSPSKEYDSRLSDVYTSAHVGSSTASSGVSDYGSLATRGAYGSDLLTRSPISFSRKTDLCQSSRISTTGKGTSYDHSSYTNSPDAGDRHRSVPPTTSYLYSNNAVSRTKPEGAVLETIRSTTITQNRPLPPVPKIARKTAKKY